MCPFALHANGRVRSITNYLVRIHELWHPPPHAPRAEVGPCRLDTCRSAVTGFSLLFSYQARCYDSRDGTECLAYPCVATLLIGSSQQRCPATSLAEAHADIDPV